MKISTDDENKKNSKKNLKINYYYKTSIMAFAAVILLFPAIGSNYDNNYSASAQVIYDDFSDNQIDSSKWIEVEEGLISPQLEETNQRVEITFPPNAGGPRFLAGYESVCELTGDFDIQVSYELLQWPQTSGVRVGLGLVDGISFWAVERVSLGTPGDFNWFAPDSNGDREVYLTDYGGHTQLIRTADSSGTLRLVRSGNTVTAYAGSNTLGSTTIATDDLRFNIAAWSHDYATTHQAVKLAFDNFVVNEGIFANCNLNPNQPPTANAGDPQTVNEGESVTLTGSGSTDPDGDTLTYAWTQTAGTTATLNDASSATPTFTAPDVGEDGETLTFELTVDDGNGHTAKDSVSITVNNVVVNQPPTANAGDPQTVNEGESVTLTGSGSTDPDGDTLTYAWTQIAGPSVTLSGENTASPSFTAPDVDTSGATLTFELTVTDNAGKTSTDTVDITVNNVVVNQPPTANAGTDQPVNEGESVELSGSASTDPDGDTLTYAWTQTEGAQVTLSDASSATPTFTAPDVGEDGETLTFELTVDDGNGHTDTDTVNIEVRDIPEPATEYTVEGFYSPVDMGSEENPVVNTVKSGRSVALKFEVFDQNNVEQTSTDVIESSRQNRIDCSTLEGKPADAIETTNTGGTTLRYDTNGGTFLQNWKTPSGKAGNCYSTTVTTVDGDSITAYFRLN